MTNFKLDVHEKIVKKKKKKKKTTYLQKMKEQEILGTKRL